MNIIQRFIKYIIPKKFNHNPEDFLLKNKESWFSEIYREIIYSANGGKNWKTIKYCMSPLFTHVDCCFKYNYEIKTLTFNCEKESFSIYKKRFKSYQDVLDYEVIQMNKYDEGRKKVEILKKKYLEKINNNIK